MMKKYFAAVIILSFPIISFSQNLAINTDGSTAHASAILDIKSSNKGLLAPRMTTAQRTAIANPATGLLVFDTDTNTFWFYKEDAWTNLAIVGPVSGWALAGNSGTDPGSHFIGTTDNQPLRFKINSEWAGEIGLTGNVFMGLRAGLNNITGTNNIAIGRDALKMNTAISGLVAIGDSALFHNGQDGEGNTAIGSKTLASNTGGRWNTAVGTSALSANTDGGVNTAIGSFTLLSNTRGFSNTALGFSALYKNTTGNFNVAIGSYALENNTTGWLNTAVGHTALVENIGNNNTAFGHAALHDNTNGTDNTATGQRALYSNTTSSFNSAHGSESLMSNTTGSLNTASGGKALSNNTTGSNNTANGYEALYKNTAPGNTATGSRALRENTTGSENTANGLDALYSNITGDQNTASGHSALNKNQVGNSNTASGFRALYNNTTGSNNSAFGNVSMFGNTMGFSNVALGHFALGTNTTGFFNTALGNLADVSTGDLNNATAVGYNAIVNASNKVRLGNSAVTVIEGQVAYSFPSDGRFKSNVSESVKGLEFIMKLRPVVYNFQAKKMNEFIRAIKQDEVKFAFDYTALENMRQTGFIAQEVEKAAKETGFDFNGVIPPKHDKDTYSLAYSQFVVPLVKAVQEQQKMIDDLKKTNKNLLQRIEALEKRNK